MIQLLVGSQGRKSGAGAEGNRGYSAPYITRFYQLSEFSKRSIRMEEFIYFGRSFVSKCYYMIIYYILPETSTCEPLR